MKAFMDEFDVKSGPNGGAELVMVKGCPTQFPRTASINRSRNPCQRNPWHSKAPAARSAT